MNKRSPTTRKHETGKSPFMQIAYQLVLLIGASLVSTSGALADYASPLLPNGTQTPTAPIMPYRYVTPNAPNVAPPTMPLPPLGAGANPPNEITGDVGNAPLITTGKADTTNGTIFSSRNAANRTTVYIYRQTAGAPARGQRMVMTLDPASLTTAQINGIDGALGINMLGGQSTITVNATNNQIQQVNEFLAPSASDPNQLGTVVASPYFANGWSQIQQDPSVNAYQANLRPGDQSLFTYAGPLATVPIFCRYLIIVGVVFGTVKMALAGYGVVMGHPHAGARVIAAASGLLLLLAAYTIYKIVMMNTMHENSTGYTNRSKNGALSTTPWGPSNVPVAPQVPAGGIQRSGVPVLPDSQN